MGRGAWLVVAGVVIGCGGGEPTPPSVEEQAAQKCPRVHMDRLAGDWVLQTGDPKTRFRVVERGGETLLWYVDPAFSNHKLELVGTRRDHDWQFDERPRGPRARLIAEGGEALKRVYVTPRIERCLVETYAGTVDAAGKEQVPPAPKTFLQWPEQQGAVFSFHPHDEPLFLGAAAASKAVADAQVAELGGPRADVEMGTVPVAAFSDPKADGDPGCAYTFDAWFDGRPVEDGAEQPASVDGAVRAWRHTFDAPYTGNHTLELHRFRRCGEGPRELIAVAGVGAILQ